MKQHRHIPIPQQPSYQQPVKQPPYQQAMPQYPNHTYLNQYQQQKAPYDPYPSVPTGLELEKILKDIDPVVDYGLNEIHMNTLSQMMSETALIAYLMGMGYEFEIARQMVENWQIKNPRPMDLRKK
jgi:hypothetical protein